MSPCVGHDGKRLPEDVAEPTQPLLEGEVGGRIRGVPGGIFLAPAWAAGQFFRQKNRNFKSSSRGPAALASGLQREADAGTTRSEKATTTFICQFPAIPFSKHRPPPLLKDVPLASLRWVLL